MCSILTEKRLRIAGRPLNYRQQQAVTISQAKQRLDPDFAPAMLKR